MILLKKLLAIVVLSGATTTTTTTTTTTAAAATRTIHVAGNGSDDANDGSASRPFATLTRARDEVRRLQPRDGGGEVVIHGGTYVLTRPLELGPEDSGTADKPTVWHSAPNEQVRIAGGPVLNAKDFAPVTSDTVRNRLPAAARDHIVQLDLTKPGDDLKLGEYPDSFRGAPAMPELLFNDKRMTVARWPNQGWATIANFVETGSIPRDGDKSGRPGVFQYAGDEPSRWNVAAGVWLQGYWCYDWYDETIRVKAVDAAQHRITLSGPAMYGVKQGNPSPRRFRAINVLDELDEPGEFYIDHAARTLYFYPPAALDPAARIVLSTLNAPLLHIKDAEHIVIRGITFEAGLANGIDIAGGRDVRIENCTVRNVRELGIHVDGGLAHRITHCDITDTGTGGIIMSGGDRKTLTPAGHEASDNHIWNFSRHQLTGAYAIMLNGVGNRATHNHIHDAPHQAIYVGGNDHIFEYNAVDHVVTETDDAAALYKGRNPSCRGNVIRYNFWCDIGNRAPGTGTAAIYFDDGDGGDVVLGNIFVRCGNPSSGGFGVIFSHGGHDIRAENNIFVDCRQPLGSVPWDDARWADALRGGQDCHFPEKLLKEVDITRPPYTTRYPELVGFMNPTPGRPRVSHAKNTVLVRCGQPSYGNWVMEGSTVWSVDHDPGFIDAAAGDYQLKPGSEVFTRLPDFKPIPFGEIGTSDHR